MYIHIYIYIYIQYIIWVHNCHIWDMSYLVPLVYIIVYHIQSVAVMFGIHAELCSTFFVASMTMSSHSVSHDFLLYPHCTHPNIRVTNIINHVIPSLWAGIRQLYLFRGPHYDSSYTPWVEHNTAGLRCVRAQRCPWRAWALCRGTE